MRGLSRVADGNTRANRLCRAQVSDLALNSCLTLGMSSLYIFCFFLGIFLGFFVVVLFFLLKTNLLSYSSEGYKSQMGFTGLMEFPHF